MKFAAAFLSLASASLLCVACGGSSPAATSPSQTTGSDSKESAEHAEHKEGGDHDKHHAALSPALKDFHGVLSPVWHSAAGAVRIEKTCTNVKSLQEKAKTTADADLIAAAAAVETACAKEGRAEVEAKLGVVHERFHTLAEPKH